MKNWWFPNRHELYQILGVIIMTNKWNLWISFYVSHFNIFFHTFRKILLKFFFSVLNFLPNSITFFSEVENYFFKHIFHDYKHFHNFLSGMNLRPNLRPYKYVSCTWIYNLISEYCFWKINHRRKRLEKKDRLKTKRFD